MNRAHNRKIMAAAMVAGALLASVAIAEDVWIKSESVDIRAGKGAVYPVVATAKKGAQLPVLAHEGKWIKVQAGDQQGYVFENAISPEKVDGGGGNLLANLGAGANAGDMSTGAAGKGLAEEADQYARNKALDPAPMNRLIDFRKKIDPKAWEAFTLEGKVGPNAPQ
ncbi:MAG: SH3 domain-containing protein [Planctomycetota bacterium]|nr:SH3 domain-containing protein [Planctomycetota bacterium]